MAVSELEIVSSLLPSALDKFRKQSSFDWKQMKLNIEDPEQLQIKMKVWSFLASDPNFERLYNTLPPEEEKLYVARQLVKFHHSGIYANINTENYKIRTRYIMTVNEATAAFNPNLSVKHALGVSLFANALLTLGTERHYHFYKDVWDGKILSCLALTEVAHGSDTKRLRTTATFDIKSQEYIIHTPDEKAAKCWVGNLGKQCTHALLFAQLWSRNECHGLQAFVVPIRDPQTLLPYSGVIVGDIGEKTGLNGIDNGFVMFNHYRVPRDNLLNRIGDITAEGEFETSFTDPQKILGAALENLSTGRVAIIQESTNTLAMAVTIAIRFGALRTQFCDAKGEELPLISYQLHQWRLFPYLAAAFGCKVFIRKFSDEYLECVEQSNSSRDGDMKQMADTVSCIHAVVCCSKSFITWITRDAIQECREACGGYGYLKASGLGDLRNNHDPKLTYEGDNNILLQQTSNWLLRQSKELRNHKDMLHFPLTCVSFLCQPEICLNYRFTGKNIEDIFSHTFIKCTFDWLVCWLIQTTETALHSLLNQNVDRISAKNQTQVFRAHTLALVFSQSNILRYFWEHCQSVEKNLRLILEKLYYLFALWCIHKNMVLLYQGGYCEGPLLANLICEAILKLCTDLCNEVVSLVDVISPPDFILNSIIGLSDGNLYSNLMQNFLNDPQNLKRPNWWREMLMKPKL
uniref:Acyl-coenzyme A oxidase n=1 Tax=Clastoptera arizonana TaxID=38151 RepID=A0A1B6BYV6_9HEMI